MTGKTERRLRGYPAYRLAPVYFVRWLLGLLSVALIAVVLYSAAGGIYS